MNVKFTLTTAEKLEDLAVTNGQLVYLQDLNEAYYDQNNDRKRIGAVEKVSSLPATGRDGTLYVVVNGESGRATPSIWDSTSSSYLSLGGEVATASSLGIVQPDNTTITISNGILTATATAPATTATAGVVKPDGTTITVESDGTISAELPAPATTATLGVVQPDGTTITVNNGVITAAATAPTTTATAGVVQPDGTTITIDGSVISAALPAAATTSTLGVVQPDGTTITVANGVISAELPALATTATAGIVQPDGTTITVNNGVISAELPAPATTATLGVVKPDGESLSVDENGTLSVLTPDTNTSKKRYTISSNSWSDTPDESGFYSYSLNLSNQEFSMNTAVNLYIAGSGDSVFPTDTEKSMYALVERIELVTTSSVKLYASTKPTSTFYVYIGADGGYAQGGGGELDVTKVNIGSTTGNGTLPSFTISGEVATFNPGSLSTSETVSVVSNVQYVE